MFNGAIFDDLGKRFKVKPGDDISLDDKLSLVKFMFAEAVVNNVSSTKVFPPR